jgi:hypothetical protein
MGDARNGDRPPLARVHDLRPRAARGTPGPSRRDDSAGTRVPSLRLVGTEVRELDGRDVADFDAADAFVARYGLDLNVAAEAMQIDAVTFGRMLVHPAAPAEDLVRVAGGMTPAQLTVAVADLRPGELAMAAAKLRSVREGWGDRPMDGEVLVMGPAEPEVEEGTGRAIARETPWSTALTISSYAARGLRSRVVAGGGRSAAGHEALGHAVRRVVLAHAMGSFGVALTRADDSDQRAAAVEVVALLLGLDARPPAAAAVADRGDAAAALSTDDFGLDEGGLRRRAALVSAARRPQLARSLRRAAELVALDDAEVRQLCASLRPAAASIDVLLAEAIDLHAREATECAAFLREAATVYAELGLGRPATS